MIERNLQQILYKQREVILSIRRATQDLYILLIEDEYLRRIKFKDNA